MRAVQVPGPDEGFETVSTERPTPGPAEVLVSVAACGVCRGDTAVTEGRPPVEYPRVPGHEIAGRIAAVGGDVDRLAVGDRVVVGWHGGHCGTCRQCRRGDFVTCEHERITGIHHDGGYAEAVAVPVAGVARVPDGVDLTAAGPLACAGLTAWTGLTSTDATAGDTVAVQGIGGVGHLAVQFADAMGFETVALSRTAEKEAAALDLGADRFVDTSETDPADALTAHGGADLVLGTAPAGGAFEAVLGGLAPNGDLVAVGAPTDAVSLPVARMLGNRWSLHGWAAGHAGDVEDALAAAARNDVDPWVETYPLDAADAAFGAMRSGEVRFRAVVEP
jgi:D-arabinose 1-dehydrogenase-like Zn-dependent alcohol dehydrogenase